jgi:hypothetical protein
MIVARDGVENWRVPDANNFYFRMGDPIPDVALSMRQLIRELTALDLPNSRTFQRARLECQSLRQTSARLAGALFSVDQSLARIRNEWTECHKAYCRLAAELRNWPGCFDAMLNDKVYEHLIGPWSELHDDADIHSESGLLLHLQNRFQDWHNSNLRKYLDGFCSSSPKWKTLYAG